ncbi:MAG: hypothetical protein AAF404_09230, partial [Pseudomonadota bacterium]
MAGKAAADTNTFSVTQLSAPERTRQYLERESELVRQYYRQVPFEDIESRSLDELNAAAISHWNFARLRAHNECLVRIYNPGCDQHGWESTHTIVEITTDDKPFLVRTVALVMTRLGFSISQLIHPIFSVVRKSNGALDGLVARDGTGASQESFMQLHIDRLFDDAEFAQIESEILKAIADVNLVCDDWERMKDASSATGKALRSAVKEDFLTAESCDFIDWLQRFHFTFTGYCELTDDNGEYSMVSDSALGIFRSDTAQRTLASCLPGAELQQIADDLLYITKSADRAPVIWPRPMDVISYKRVDSNAKENGRCVICGFFTSRADNTDLDGIPILRHKLHNIVARSNINPGAHDGKILLNTLEGFPRDLLLQSDEPTIA